MDVIKNIESYIDNMDNLIVVDNSSTKNENIYNILEQKYGEKIIYIENHDNLGIAKALNIGADKSLQMGCDWLLTMDQDSRFINFSSYLSCFHSLCNKNNIAIISQIHIEQENQEIFEISILCCNETDKKLVMTSGNLINLNIFQSIGGFTEKLFIDEVDHDYCLRVQKYGCIVISMQTQGFGTRDLSRAIVMLESNKQVHSSEIIFSLFLDSYRIVQFDEVKLLHSLGDINNKDTLVNKRIRRQHNYIRRYYITRNALYMAKTYSSEFNEFKWSIVLYQRIYRAIWKILTREDDKMKKIISVILGIKDFSMNRYESFRYKY
jgi:rhamnosyltransferase